MFEADLKSLELFVECNYSTNNHNFLGQRCYNVYIANNLKFS